MRISDWSSDVCSSDLFPDLQRALVLALAADPHALGVITRIPKGARAACADPLAAALVALLLFLEPLFQRLHDLVPVAERLDRGHFLGRQEFLGDRLQPVGGDVDRVLAIVGDDALEDLVEHMVEAVEQALVLHVDRAGQVIALFGAAVDHLAVRSEEHTSELQSLMRPSYAVFCLKTKNT